MEENTAQEKTAKPAKETKTARPSADTPKAERTRPVYERRTPQRCVQSVRPLNASAAPARPNGAKPMDARELNKLSVQELTKLAVNYNIEDISGLRKQELIGRIVAVQAKQNGSVYGGGVL